MGTMKCLIGNIMHSPLKWYVVSMLFCLAVLNHGTDSNRFLRKKFRIKLLSKLLLRLSKQGNWNEHWI